MIKLEDEAASTDGDESAACESNSQLVSNRVSTSGSREFEVLARVRAVVIQDWHRRCEVFST
jgi:hypothetical protein